MQLKSLELSGFKSFAKKATLEFNSKITAIVGPNGSGKSNVAEAFRFVLGEQSIKSLRGKRGEDLIWNGSGDLPKGNRASVKVVFDNARKIFPIDFDEVSIERVVHRDSSNEYYINNSQVRLKDVVELLSSANIGASGHHIISQGEADRILSANTRDRREIIEDALGLKVYQYKKAESLKKLEKTEENIEKVESLRREIAPHLKFLKKQVEKVQKAREYRDALRVLYKNYFALEKKRLDFEKTLINIEIVSPKEEYEKLASELEKVKRIIAESNKQDEKSKVLLEVESRMMICSNEKEQINREVGKIEGEISSQERFLRIEESKKRNEENRMIKFSLVKDIAKEIETNILEVENSEDLSIVKSTLRKIKDNFSRFLSSISTNDSENHAEIDSVKKEILELNEKRAKILSQIKEISDRENALRMEYRQIKEIIEKEKDTNRDAEKEVFRIVARQNELRNILESLRLRENVLQSEQIEFENDLKEAYLLAGRESVDYESVYSTNQEISNLSQEFLKSTELKNKVKENKKEIEKLKVRLEEAGGAGGVEVEKEFKETTERDEFLLKELADLKTSSDSLKQIIQELTEKLNNEFKEGVQKINTEFSRLFELMFGGGNAQIVITKEKKRVKNENDISSVLDEESNVSEEEYEEGIDISVSLPRKKIKGLMMLSGGERALTSIALLFAVSQVQPPPFIILDETDAALDEANSRKYGDMVARLSEHSQLILITHNRETMSRAGVLYGITMGKEGASKMLSIKFDEAVQVAK